MVPDFDIGPRLAPSRRGEKEKLTALLAVAVSANESSCPSVTVLLPGSVKFIVSASAATGKRNRDRIVIIIKLFFFICPFFDVIALHLIVMVVLLPRHIAIPHNNLRKRGGKVYRAIGQAQTSEEFITCRVPG